MKKKKIVMLGTAFDTKGGVASVVNVYRAAGLFERWRIVYIATHRDGGSLRKFMTAGGALTKYLWMLLVGRVGAVHIHTSSRASFWRKVLFFLPAFAMSKPAILHLHGSEFQVFAENECGAVRRAVIRWVFRRTFCVVVLSHGWCAWVNGFVTGCRVVVISNPVVLPPYLPYEHEPGLVLFAGRLGLRKGTFDLLEAMAAILVRMPSVKLAMAGDGDADGSWKRAHDLGIAESVELAGWLTGERKATLFRRATVFCLPSYHEGLPMALLEAMSFGLPVISTRVGGIPEAVSEGVEGLLVEPGDVPGLGQALMRLLGDPQLRAEMGKAARARVEDDFSVERVIPRVEALYREMGFAPLAGSD